MSDSVWPHRQQPTRLPHPWDSPDQNTGVGCHFLLQYLKVKSESEVPQLCPTLSDPVDCSPPGSSVHGIFQARVLEWVAIARQYNKKQRHYFANKGLSSESYCFSSSHVWMWELGHKERWAQKNWFFLTVVLEKTLENSLDCKIKPVNSKRNQLNIHWMNWCWSWSSNTLATGQEELTHLKRPWCWERLKVGGKGDARGWDGWMASPTWWTWVWASSRSWRWTGKPGMLHSMGLQRVRHDWVTELNH